MSSFWVVTSCSATQEFPNILWKPKLHYRVDKSPPLVSILSQINPVRTVPSYFSKSTVILSSNLHLRLPSYWSLFLTSQQNLVCIPILPHACYMPAHLILHDLIVVIVFGEVNKLWSPSLCSCLQPRIRFIPIRTQAPAAGCLRFCHSDVSSVALFVRVLGSSQIVYVVLRIKIILLWLH
jgi:hypothetical protein